jgi:RNA polymerase sigma-70 factor (ECF subfamily)
MLQDGATAGLKGRPAPEVARELGLSENAVSLARCRVLRRLRAERTGLIE